MSEVRERCKGCGYTGGGYSLCPINPAGFCSGRCERAYQAGRAAERERVAEVFDRMHPDRIHEMRQLLAEAKHTGAAGEREACIAELHHAACNAGNIAAAGLIVACNIIRARSEGSGAEKGEARSYCAICRKQLCDAVLEDDAP